MPQRELVVCCIFRGEAPYLAEWIEFHHLMGASHFFMYQNRSEDNWAEVLAPFVDAGLVTIEQWPHESPCQLSAYSHFIQRHKGEEIWAAFLDCDEFLFSPRFARVTDVLNATPYASYGSFGVNWMVFGAGGQLKKEEGLVIERFIQRLPAQNSVNAHIKTIGRLDSIEGPLTPHCFACRLGAFGEAGNHIIGSFSPPSHEVLRINHYTTKSWEEWLIRRSRPRADANIIRDRSEFHAYQQPSEEDRTILRFLPELRSRLAARRG